MEKRRLVLTLRIVLNWLIFACLAGAVIGIGSGMLTAMENGYLHQGLRGLVGRLIEHGSLLGASRGLLAGAVGLVVCLVAWPISRVLLRSSSAATVGAALAVPLFVVYAVAGYLLNIEVLPGFLSTLSLLGNAALAGAVFLVWWIGVRWLGRYQAKCSAYAASAVTTGALCGLLALGLGSATAARHLWGVSVSPEAPNVLLVVIDTLRADRLGVFGYDRDTSPNLDKLASEGWQYTSAISQASWTKPSVTSIMTGLYPSQTSVNPGEWARRGADGAVFVQSLAPEHITLAERMAAGGYETAAFGRNHHLISRLGFSQGFLTYDWELLQSLRLGFFGDLARRVVPRPTFSVGWITEHFSKWLDENGDRKFFAYLHHIDVHWPYRSPAPFSGMYRKEEPGRDFNSGPVWNALTNGQAGSEAAIEPRTMRAMNDAYDEGIRFVDDGLGRVFADLKRRGLYDNTLIIVTADHGEEFLDHGGLEHGRSLYDELINVPLIVKFPCPGANCAPRVVSSQVELVDIFPTVLQAAGLEPGPQLVGRSLAEPTTDGRTAYSEWRTSISLRLPEWKWIYHQHEDSGELYHLAVDPGETADVALDEPELAKILTAEVLDFAASRERVVSNAETSIRADAGMLENLKALGYVQ